MKRLQRWRQTTLANQVMSITSLFMMVATIAIAFATILQYYTSRNQLSLIRDQVDAAKDQAKVMQGQLGVLQDQASSMKEQTNALKDSLTETRRTADAAISQSNTSQVAAKAAQESARIAQETMVVGSRPYVTAGLGSFSAPKPGERVHVQVKFVNDGNSPAQVTALLQLLVLDYPVSPGHMVSANLGQFSEMVSLQPTTIPPRKEVNVNVYSGVPLTPLEWEKVKAYKKFLIIYGEGLASGLGGKAPVRICAGLVYEPDHNGWQECAK